MQDCYVGDIGDYGKYGLLRQICKSGLSLSVNWYKVTPLQKGKQDDGKFISYLHCSDIYKEYDSELFDALYRIVVIENDRTIRRIENEKLFIADYFSHDMGVDRDNRHRSALEQTKDAQVVFLDPDNGLETSVMNSHGKCTEKHVRWQELKDYYDRGQNVILYQHRPQMTKKEKCISDIMSFNDTFLRADYIKLLEFPKYTNRLYFMFIHEEYGENFDVLCKQMSEKWGRNGFCREIKVNHKEKI